MQVQKDEFKSAIEKAREITETQKLYYLNSDAEEKSLPNLLDLCQKYLNNKIEAWEHKMQHDGQPIRGYCMSFADGHYEITLLGGQNRCWKRLVLCKELFHVIMDREEYRNPIISKLIDDAAVSFPDPLSRPDLPFAAEALAEIAAIEYLFPFERRKAIKQQLEAGEEIDFHDIANRYGIPQLYVESYLKDKVMNMYADLLDGEDDSQ